MKHYDYYYSKLAGLSQTTINIVENVVESLNNGDYNDIYECINDTIDNSLIYYRNQWDVLEDFCTPAEADYNYAIEELYNLVSSAIYEEEVYDEEAE